MRQLSSVSDTDLQVDYTYDASGIRTSKTVNGVTTQYNTKDGVILAQSDGENTLYFQYDTNGVPFAFVWNGTQYYYVTNQMGDVMGITDDSGNLLVQYSYDAWGKLLGTTLTDANDQTQQQLAALNPLLYRGYYYDTETGYYYLQSRYYDPNLCRFINSDVLEMSGITKDTEVGTNMFAYCSNDSVNQKDTTGTEAIVLGAAALGVILIAALVAIGIGWALSTIIRNIDYSFVSQTLNNIYREHKIKATTIKALVVGAIKPAYKYVKKQIKSKTKAISKAISIAVADAQVKTKVKKGKGEYWSVTRASGCLIIGKKISRSQAIARMRKGLDVFAINNAKAKSIAKSAYSNKKPVGPEKDKGKSDVTGYYWHYHVFKRKYKSHAFFL